MFLFEIIIEVIVDWTFWLIFDKRRRMLINDISSAGIIVWFSPFYYTLAKFIRKSDSFEPFLISLQFTF